MLLQSGVLCLLLIGGVNLAGLLLIRASGREKEIAVRKALGVADGILYLLFAHNLLFEHNGVFGLEHEGLVAGTLSWFSVRVQRIRFHQPIWHAYAALLFAVM